MGSMCAAVAMVLTVAGLASARGVACIGREDRRAGLQEHHALKGTPADELNQSMHLMKGALGVDCTYCHVEREWDKDV